MESSTYNNLPISFVTTDVQGKILRFNPWASQLLNVEVGEFIQAYFFEEDARSLIETMQSCEPIFGEILRLESSDDSILHMRCTSIREGVELNWMFEHVSDLVSIKERLDKLKVLPRAFGHEINNFLTVIGSAAESIHGETQNEWIIEDAETILIMTQRAATMTRQFMNLGRKSLLPHELIEIQTVIAAELSLLERVIGQEGIPVHCTDELTQVFASKWWLKNMLLHMAMCFENESVSIHVDVQFLNYHFANKVIGQSAGEYVVVTMCTSGFEYQIDTILSTRYTVASNADELQGLWEGVTRFRGGVSTYRLSNKSRAVSVFIPWVRLQT